MGRNVSTHSESPVRDNGSRRSPSRREKSPTRHRRSHRASSPTIEKHSSNPKSPKRAISPPPVARSPSPRTKRLRRAQAARESEREPERKNGRAADRDLQKEGGSARGVGGNRKEKLSGDDIDGKSSRSRQGASPSDRQRRSRHRSPSPQPAGDIRGGEEVIEKDRERSHGRRTDRSMPREKGLDKEMEKERVEKRSGKDSDDHRSSRSRHGRSTSPLDRRHRNRHRSHSPQQTANTRGRDEVPNSRESELRDDENDAVAMMMAAEEALDAKQKQKPSFELSGKLADETNRVRGVTLLFTEPPEARKPDVRWRLYVFKGGEALDDPLYIHRQSCYLFGRERRVADVPTDHPSCSKQHAVIQYRQVDQEKPDGTMLKQVRPYLMDLGSTNKTFLNDNAIESHRYYELMEKDTIKFE